MQRPCQRNKRRTKNCPTRNRNYLFLRNVHGCILLFSRLLAALLFLLIRAGSVAGARLLPIRTYWSAGAAQAVSPPLMSAVAAPAEEHSVVTPTGGIIVLSGCLGASEPRRMYRRANAFEHFETCGAKGKKVCRIAVNCTLTIDYRHVAVICLFNGR